VRWMNMASSVRPSLTRGRSWRRSAAAWTSPPAPPAGAGHPSTSHLNRHPFLPLKVTKISPNVSAEMCSRQAEKWTSVSL
jgi:hypothetical protein